MQNGLNGKSRSHGDVREWRVKGKIVGLCITSRCECNIGRWALNGCALVALANEAWVIQGSEAQTICLVCQMKGERRDGQKKI
jgi:hypothetical protein